MLTNHHSKFINLVKRLLFIIKHQLTNDFYLSYFYVINNWSSNDVNSDNVYLSIEKMK